MLHAAALPENVGVATVCLDGYGDQETALEVLEGTDLVSSTVISGNGDLASLCSALVYTPTTVLVRRPAAIMARASPSRPQRRSRTDLFRKADLRLSGRRQDLVHRRQVGPG